MLADQQPARVRDALVQVRPVLFIQERDLRFVEAVKGIRRSRVGGLVRMDEEGLFAVLDFDVFFWDAGLEVEDGVSGVQCRLDFYSLKGLGLR